MTELERIILWGLLIVLVIGPVVTSLVGVLVAALCMWADERGWYGHPD